MRKLFFFIFSVTTLCINACEPPLQRDEVGSWLKTMSGNKEAEVDASGDWNDENSWGEMKLSQNGNKITGKLSDYDIIGKVGGKFIYMVILYEETVYYTMTLKMTNDSTLTGYYFDAKDVYQESGTEVSFKKGTIQDQEIQKNNEIEE